MVRFVHSPCFLPGLFSQESSTPLPWSANWGSDSPWRKVRKRQPLQTQQTTLGVDRKQTAHPRLTTRHQDAKPTSFHEAVSGRKRTEIKQRSTKILCFMTSALYNTPFSSWFFQTHELILRCPILASQKISLPRLHVAPPKPSTKDPGANPLHRSMHTLCSMYTDSFT